MRLERPDAGQIEGLPDKISAVFQEERLCGPFSALANVRLVTGKSVSHQTIVQHLADIGLSGSMQQPVRTLSGGQQRRVSIVRAMLADSELILLDEPFKGLDADTKKPCFAIRQGKSGREDPVGGHPRRRRGHCSGTGRFMDPDAGRSCRLEFIAAGLHPSRSGR